MSEKDTRGFPWVKMHTKMLADEDFVGLSVLARHLYVCSLLSAASNASEDGVILSHPEALWRMCGSMRLTSSAPFDPVAWAAHLAQAKADLLDHGCWVHVDATHVRIATWDKYQTAHKTAAAKTERHARTGGPLSDAERQRRARARKAELAAAAAAADPAEVWSSPDAPSPSAPF